MTKRIVVLGILISMVFAAGTVYAQLEMGEKTDKHFDPSVVPSPADYSLDSSWVSAPGPMRVKDVDVVYLHPTTFMDPDRWNEPMDEAEDNEKTKGLLEKQAGVYADSCNVYMPLFRQASIIVLGASEEDSSKTLEVAYSDVSAAFDHYMEHFNGGRPFVLAGHSQGSELLLMLLKRRFADDELRGKMVAAYVIGWSVTSSDIAECPFLRMSEFPGDTGCVISYNTQGKDAEYSLVKEGAVSVNPLLWNTSGKYAPKELNLGAVFFSNGKTVEVPHFTGAQNMDGALIVPEPDTKYGISVPYKGFYHGYDYSFFYRNLQQNVKDRVEAYLEKE